MGSIGFNWVQLGSLGLILADVGDLAYRVSNLKNESNTQTDRQTDRGFLGCIEIQSDLITRRGTRGILLNRPGVDRAVLQTPLSYIH